VALRARLIRARREVKSCEAQLYTLGLMVDDDRAADFSVEYRRRRSLGEAWRKARTERLSAIQRLKTQATIDLINLPAKKAQGYLLKLQAKLKAI
jgi:hypothetical protein